MPINLRLYPAGVVHSLVDRLGSPSTLLKGRTSSPVVLRYRAHGIFGKPIDAGTGSILDSLSSWDGQYRGYTGHEQLVEQQLIHMNGRIYDYNLGRFMSVDPFIQMPESSQSINPYSYIMNNPMAGTDPTGYLAAMSDAEQPQMATDTQKAEEANVTEEREVNHFGGRVKSKVSVVIGKATITNGAVTSVQDLKGNTVATTKDTSGIGKPSGNNNGTSGARIGGESSAGSVGTLDTPNLMYAELAEGVAWGGLSAEQQEYVINQDKMISKATADILAIPPGSVLETDNTRGFRDTYSNIKYIFHSERLSGNTGSAHALVPHQAFGKNGKITKVMFSSEIHYSSSKMSNFRNGQAVTRSEGKLGYHANLRSGMNGLYDLTLHEMGHTFNQSNPIGLTGAQFQKQEEFRADSFLKEIRGF
ncbi:RHS repeat-associated core domain-containing protein [Aliiglaciecola sp. 2_MG-2023]|uniref:RHS repeat domain-containing protein n=1 Tax=unclassified Aliiglaciecola TaxID=2593648 RepID=UPI0026E2FFBD|nr:MULTISPECIES: RHS repeat-associated core domain-containing protein [unclassified Aliiglaciecola]MDO6710202.1 RHS repeat-associated core domain-containing protein [Aliiglaciecola sp. 2_MG-2023]MDO6751350.1 RHS repeat-associated core domain-containing protein [Aliiglaciecola sp. 1_MG-2023]